jgi:hypothetical protein
VSLNAKEVAMGNGWKSWQTKMAAVASTLTVIAMMWAGAIYLWGKATEPLTEAIQINSAAIRNVNQSVLDLTKGLAEAMTALPGSGERTRVLRDLNAKADKAQLILAPDSVYTEVQ